MNVGEKKDYIISSTHEEKYTSQRKLLSSLKEKVEMESYNNKLNTIVKGMKFIRTFNSKGVQGVVGLVSLLSVDNEEDTPMVFKLSTDINRTVEHEYEIMEYLNELRNYCPHFSRSIGMINLPISNDFIFDSYGNNLFSFDDETLPRNILFMEYINKLPLYKLCEDCKDKNIIISQILQVIIALQISQNKKQLTHYDLHTANILIQTCESNSVFLYKIEGEILFIPTFGFFPMIIDMGISFSPIINGKNMMSNTDNYDHGFQSTEFDNLNDVHHFLITLFYYIEPDSDAFYSLSNKIKFIFRHLPILRKSGWKTLPNDLCSIVIDKLKEECDDYRDYSLFKEYDKQSLELFNNLIKLPIKCVNEDVNFSEGFPIFMEEYHKLLDIDDFSEHDTLFVLREIISLVNKYRDEYTEGNEKKCIKEFKIELKEIISPVLKENIFYDNVDYEKMLLSLIVFGEKLESVYYELIKHHKEIIKDKYKKTSINSPLDMFKYISKNITPHFNINNETIVYIWDTDNKSNKKVDCGKLSEEDIERVNNECFLKKGKLLYEMY